MIGQIYATTKLRRQLQNRNGKYDGFTKKGSFYNSELSIDCYMAQHIRRKSISSLHHKSYLDLGFGLFCQNQAKQVGLPKLQCCLRVPKQTFFEIPSLDLAFFCFVHIISSGRILFCCGVIICYNFLYLVEKEVIGLYYEPSLSKP